MMKTLLFMAVVLLSCCNSYAQSPQSFPFQAVARDTFGTPIPNQSMKARLSIIDSLPTGSVVYQETDTIVTDNLGMFAISVGKGTVVSGNFSTVNWGRCAKYIKVEIDPAGGTSYLNMGTTQMLSVPYALYSLSSGATTAPTKNRFGITIDGLGDVITTGSKGFTQINYTGTITGWTVLSDQSGSCVIDVKKSTYAGFPATTSVAGTALPTLSSSQKNTNTTLSGWGSTAITSGDMFEFVVNSATTVKRVTLVIETSIP